MVLDIPDPSAQNSCRRIKSENASEAFTPAFPEIFPRNFMSSAVISTTAALGRPFVFEDEASDRDSTALRVRSGVGMTELDRVRSRGGMKELGHTLLEPLADPRLAAITPASWLGVRPAPEMVSSGIAAIDALTGGLPRGCLTEICGPASSGRTTLLLAAVGAATRRGEFCVVVDASDALDPQSAGAAGGGNGGRVLGGLGARSFVTKKSPPQYS